MEEDSDAAAVLSDLQARARRWLLDHAAPLWRERGVDWERGGFVERLSHDGAPDETERRTRVAARQVYCFATAKRLGWTGPAEQIARAGVEWLLGPARRPDGLIAHRTGLAGAVIEAGPDLYDQAFFLLALAAANPLAPDLTLEIEAKLVLTRLRETMAHPGGGFEDALPRRSPLRANPHMHLFEAALAWHEASSDPIWSDLAREMHNLALERFIDAETGALREFFKPDWTPVAPERQAYEPGHHFEWAWLLLRWRRLSGTDSLETAARLFEIGEHYGVDPAREVAIDELGAPDFAPRIRTARLWPQTERLKAGVALAGVSSGSRRTRALSAAVSACQALERYLTVPLPGLWRDRMREDGGFIEESAPASSFYHLVCAYSELLAVSEA